MKAGGHYFECFARPICNTHLATKRVLSFVAEEPLDPSVQHDIHHDYSKGIDVCPLVVPRRCNNLRSHVHWSTDCLRELLGVK